MQLLVGCRAGLLGFSVHDQFVLTANPLRPTILRALQQGCSQACEMSRSGRIDRRLRGQNPRLGHVLWPYARSSRVATVLR